MRVALSQLSSGPDRGVNLDRIEAIITRASEGSAELVLLPEACAYRGEPAPELVEERSGPTLTRLSAAAARHGLAVLVGGLWLATDDPARPHNASVFIDPSGRIVAEYHKVHLFRLETTDVSEDEGTYTTPGDQLVMVTYRGISFALSICYDLRFPELYRALARAGADVLCVPSNFSAVTGAVHWEPLLRARAIENLCYVLAPAQEGMSDDGFATHGRSLAVDPWGRVLADLDDGTDLVMVDLDPAVLARSRAALNAPGEVVPAVYDREVLRVVAGG
ncbi:nitrilase-related carbon-nitrogen hydrolase [Kribbella catacumbae]|uniref:nitrilase-related carbon-nitrogen hydrolase n=1 Tax=Kribbella catacumbae TaxID=460086 RepID=UPI0003A92D90|nr:nitrilase-related carbon-nitrogen hydrolase [Kribbella catacumbae]